MPSHVTRRYREASDENRQIVEGITGADDRLGYINYLRDREWQIFTPRAVEFDSFAKLVESDPALKKMLELETDGELVAEILCRKYPHLFFGIEHVYRVFTDWKIKWTKRSANWGVGTPDPLPIPDHLIDELEDSGLEIVARRWFRKEIRRLNRNPAGILKELKQKMSTERQSAQRRLIQHLLKIINHFLGRSYPEFVSELENGKPFPSIHVRHWVEQTVKRGNALIVGDVGTQKTSAAVVALHELGCKAVVIVCRSYAKTMWVSEVKRYHRTPVDPYIVQGAQDIEVLEHMKHADLLRHRYFVVGFGNVQAGQIEMLDERGNGDSYGDRVVKALARLKPDGIIIDEAHAIKGGGDRSRRVLHLARSKSVRHRVMLTATPFENHPNEVANLATLLDPKDFPTEETFLAACRDNPRTYFSMMAQRMCDYFTQEDVLSLPSTNLTIHRFFPTVALEPTSEMQTVLATVQNDGTLEAKDQVCRLVRFLSVPSVAARWYPHLRDLQCFKDPLLNPKLAYLKREVAERIKNGKVVIASGIYASGITREFGEQDLDLPTITALFEEWFPGKILCIDGATTGAAGGREQVQHRWRTDSEARILVASVPAASESLNFTLKRKKGIEKITVFYLSLPWKPTQYLQFNGRFRRPGSEVPLEVLIPIVRGTADEALLELNERKWRNFLIGVHGMPLLEEEENALQQATFEKLVTTPNQWLKDMFHFMLGAGEDRIDTFLGEDLKGLPVGKTAADYYLKTEEYGTSGHIARVTAPTLKQWHAQGLIPSWEEVLDVGPGPLILERKIGAPLSAIEINPSMVELGRAHSPHGGRNAIVGRASSMPRAWSKRFSIVVASLMLDLTSRRRKRGTSPERVRVLQEFHRVLKRGGLLWCTIQKRRFDEESFDNFLVAVERFGFEVVQTWSNRIEATDEKQHPFAFWSILLCKKGKPEANPAVPLFLHELTSVGAPRPKGKKTPKVAGQPNLVRHEQFAIRDRTGGLVPIDTAAKKVQVTSEEEDDVVYYAT